MKCNLALWTAVCLMVICSSPAIQAQFMSGFIGEVFENSQPDFDAAVMVPDCGSGFYEIPIQVSGLPNFGPDFGLREVEADWQLDDMFGATIILEAPNGSEFTLATPSSFPDHTGVSGSQADFFQVDFKACDHFPSSTSAGVSGDFTDVKADEGWQSLQTAGIDPNGTWKIKVCFDPSQPERVWFFSTELLFQTATPIITTLNTTDAANCGESGMVDLAWTTGVCNRFTVATVQGESLGDIAIKIPYDAVSESGTTTALALQAGKYTVRLFESDATESIGTQLDQEEFEIKATDATGSMLTIVDCPPSETIPAGVDYELSQPTYTSSCGLAVTKSVTIIDPSGSGTALDLTGNNDRIKLAMVVPGTYTLDWSGTDGTNTQGCQTIITVEESFRIDCEPFFELPLNGTSRDISINTPTYTGAIDGADYFVVLPDGTNDGPFEIDLNNLIGITYTVSTPGDYEIVWRSFDDMNNEVASCVTPFRITEGTQSVFASAQCGAPAALVPVCDASTGPTSFSASVSNVGLATETKTVLGIQVEANISGAFDHSLVLIAPNGFSYQLVDAAQGSLPAFDGTLQSFDILFENCGLSPRHDDNAAANVFQTIDPLFFAPGDLLDGEWRIEACSYTAGNEMEFVCFEVVIDEICPRILAANITDASCTGGGAIAFGIADVDQGACPIDPVVYSIDAGTTWSATTSFNDLMPGEYTILAGYEGATEIYCVSENKFTVGGMGGTEDPKLENCPADQTIMLSDAGSVDWMVTAPTATDDCGISAMTLTTTADVGVTSEPFTSGGMVMRTANAAGTITLEWKVTDGDGNEVTCETKITVTEGACAMDTEDPVLTMCPTAMRTLSISPDTGRAQWRMREPQRMDNCEIDTAYVEIMAPSGNSSRAMLAAGQRPLYRETVPGVMTVTYIVVDKAGNTSTCTATINLIEADPCAMDVIKPRLIDCPLDRDVSIGARGFASWTMVDPTIVENCQLDTAYLMLTSNVGTTGERVLRENVIHRYRLDDPGVYIYSFIAVDTAGNADTCITNVTVLMGSQCNPDTRSPVLLGCPPSRTVVVKPGERAEWFMTEPRYADNCEMDTAFVTIKEQDGGRRILPGKRSRFRTMERGTLTYVWTAIDVSGNMQTCETAVTIVERVEREAQETYCADICDDPDARIASRECATDSYVEIPIEVFGIGNLSAENGLVEVEIDARMKGIFQAEIVLENPDGAQSVLASTSEGSFPTYLGSDGEGQAFLNISFRDCFESQGEIPFHSHTVPSDQIENRAFVPVQDITTMNLDGATADGTWKLLICHSDTLDPNDPEDFIDSLIVTCVKLHFGSVCPEITDYVVTNAGCDDTGGGIINITEVDFDRCRAENDAVVFSIDGDQNWVTERFFTGLAAGTYEISVGAPIYDNGNFLGAACESTITIEVPAAGDMASPVIEDCPKDFVYSLRFGDEITFSMPTPTFYDDCGFVGGLLTIHAPGDEDPEQIQITSAAQVEVTLSTPGTHSFVWTVTAGTEESSCTTIVEVNDEITSTFCADICLDDVAPLDIEACVENCETLIPIEVFGIGELSADYGLTQINVFGSFDSAYAANIKLISPSGYELWLSGDALGSFSTHDGLLGGNNRFDVGFRRCAALPYHDEPVAPESVPGGDFNPRSSPTFLSLNVDEIADGTWYLAVCKTDPDENMIIDCVSLDFGQMMPEVREFAVGNAGCDAGSTGSFEVTELTGGFCLEGLRYSIDGGTTWSSESSFTDLQPGDYELITGILLRIEDDGTEVISSLLRDMTSFSIEGGGGQEEAQLWNCPADISVTIDRSYVWRFSGPYATDDCGVEGLSLTVMEDGNVLREADVDPRQSFIEFFPATEDGTIERDYIWSATDSDGNVSSCTTKVALTIDVEEEVMTSSHDLKLVEALMIFPNPTQDRITVEARLQQASNASIGVFNLHGQLLKRIQLGRTENIRTQIDMSELSSGLYFIQILADERQETRRVAKH